MSHGPSGPVGKRVIASSGGDTAQLAGTVGAHLSYFRFPLCIF